MQFRIAGSEDRKVEILLGFASSNHIRQVSYRAHSQISGTFLILKIVLRMDLRETRAA